MTHKTPDAYGLLDEGEVHYATPFRDEAEAALRRTGDKDSVIVALYRSPTLTDEEREAITLAAGDSSEWHRPHAQVLLRLLDRTRTCQK